MTRKSPSKGNPGSSFDNASKHMIPDGDDADLGLNSVLSASTQECIEISEDELALEQGLGIGLSESMLAAQKEADEIADAAEADTSNTAALVDENAALPAMPRLLQLPKQDLVAKTQELQNRGEQLDLLLLKAESYSKFILDNQKKSKMAALAELGVDTLADGADSANPENPSSGGKKRVGGNEAKSRTKKASKSSTGDSSPGQENSAESSTTENDGSVSTYGGTIIMRQPESLKGGQLMSYQLEGLQWLLSLWENGLSGILADEMGLGKTIQIISLIAHLRAHDTPGPFMIVGPLATLPNWINEFKKWLPSCPVVLYHGAKAERQALRKQHMPIHASKGMQFPVVITSFEICMIDRPHLERYTWQYMILDEGHRIKNRQCKLLRELKQIRTISRLLLTGTPIQNTLEELWSLLNFCSPNIFDNLEVFQSWFGFRNIGTDTQVDDIVSTEHKQRVVSKLHEILRPFLLRRMKADVLLTMPPKREVVVYCGMSSLQREFSHMILNKTLTKQMLNELGIEGSGGSSSAGSGLMNPTMQLRKAANHPFLFGEPKDEQGRYLSDVNPKLLIMASGKLRLLDRMLVRLKRDGHKVLIFR